MKIHILADNRTRERGFLAEHGLSLFIEYGNMHILFDTGQSDVYQHNAALMDVDLQKTDCIVLSHGHYDHCGGLTYFPKSDRFPKIYAHETAFAKRYVQNPDGTIYREIGIPWSCEERENFENSIIYTRKNKEIAPGVHLCGEIPSTMAFEEVPRGFYCGEDYSHDFIKDEQMLVLNGEKGLSLFLGCSHPGIINCLHHAAKLFPGEKIHMLMAGMHLDGVSPLRLQMTIQHMIDLDIQKVVPLHCTGIFAICTIKQFLKDRCLPLCAGDSLEL